ncbi:hypothetical protein Tco_1569514 [Tanacetum coccineum]
MTRSSTIKLFTPYKEPEREFRSSRRHFKTLSLDELRSPDFNLLSDQEYSEEEEAEAMEETMEQYMSKTRTDYGSGVARPKIDNKDQFELKGQNVLRSCEESSAWFQLRSEDAKKAIQEMVAYSQKWNNGTSRGRSTETSDRIWSTIQAQNEQSRIERAIETVYEILPFLSTARSKIDVYKRKITLRVGEEKIIFKSVKPASSLIRRVYMLGLRERMELDLEARLMGETLVLNRSLDPFLEDYIELNDLNEPVELRRNQGDDLMPTIEEGEVIEEFRTRDEDLDTGIDNYPSYCDDDKKIHIDCAHNLRFSCMIGFEFTHANFFPLLSRNECAYFCWNFSVVTDFAVLENMDAYRDEGMGDVIVGEPFLREVGIKAKRFEGIITLYNDDDEVTYQMMRSHPRFKHHTNEQCNKIPPLLKVSEKDKKNGISHAYQKLKRFYKGVLNLGPDYIRNAKTEEWLTHGHISVHEME